MPFRRIARKANKHRANLGHRKRSTPGTSMQIDQRTSPVQSTTETLSSLMRDVRAEIKTLKWLLITAVVGTFSLVVNAFLT